MVRNQDFGKVAVLLGGRSAERAISLRSGHAVLDALLRQGVDAHPFDPSEQHMEQLLQRGFNRSILPCTDAMARTVPYKAHWNSWAFPIPGAA